MKIHNNLQTTIKGYKKSQQEIQHALQSLEKQLDFQNSRLDRYKNKPPKTVKGQKAMSAIEQILMGLNLKIQNLTGRYHQIGQFIKNLQAVKEQYEIETSNSPVRRVG